MGGYGMTDLRLFDCVPFSARITHATCKANRERGVWACARCDGLTGTAEVIATAPVKTGKRRGRAATALPVDRRKAIRLTFSGEQAKVVRAMQELVSKEGSGPLEDLLITAMMKNLKAEGVSW